MAHSFKTSYFVLLIVVFVFSFGIANFQSTLTMFLTYKFDYSPNDIAIVMIVGGSIGVIVKSLRLIDCFNCLVKWKIILFGLLLAAFSLYGLLYVSGFYIILLVATLFSIATTLIRPAVNTLISKTAEHEQGYAAGMNNSYMSLGTIIGPALAGTLFDWHMNIPFTFGTLILISCFFITFVWQNNCLTEADNLIHGNTWGRFFRWHRSFALKRVSPPVLILHRLGDLPLSSKHNKARLCLRRK